MRTIEAKRRRARGTSAWVGLACGAGLLLCGGCGSLESPPSRKSAPNSSNRAAASDLDAKMRGLLDPQASIPAPNKLQPQGGGAPDLRLVGDGTTVEPPETGELLFSLNKEVDVAVRTFSRHWIPGKDKVESDPPLPKGLSFSFSGKQLKITGKPERASTTRNYEIRTVFQGRKETKHVRIHVTPR